MAASKNAVAVKKAEGVTPALDKDQVLRASKALLRKIQSDTVAKKSEGKANLLDDADEEDAEDELPVWLILTTKKHVIDKKRLKPSKIALPHPYLNASDANLRICLITADPQRKYKDLVADPSFPTEISQVVRRVIDIKKLASKYKSFESRRQLFGEHDVFLADDRIITRLPKTLGKVFYKSGSKRPIPISLEGKRQDVDEEGNKRRKLSEGGAKVVRTEVKPTEIAREIERTLNSALVHLAPSTTTAVKVGVASMEPEALQENVEAVVSAMVERFVPQKWSNLRAVHIKGPSTVALPIWLAEELWETEQDVLEEPLPAREGRKKRTRSTLEAADESKPEIIEVPGPDGELRQIELPSKKKKSAKVETEAEGSKAKKQKKSKDDEDAAEALKAATQAAEAEKKEKAARKAALQKQKSDAKTSAGKKVKSK